MLDDLAKSKSKADRRTFCFSKDEKEYIVSYIRKIARDNQELNCGIYLLLAGDEALTRKSEGVDDILKTGINLNANELIERFLVRTE